MLARARPLPALDPERVDLRRGLVGLVPIVVAIAFIAVFGTTGMTAGIAALFVIAADSPGAPRERIRGVLVVTSMGAPIGSIAVWAGTDHASLATLLTFGITAVATLAAGRGHAAEVHGLLLSLWAVLALSAVENEQSPARAPGRLRGRGGGALAAGRSLAGSPPSARP